MHPVPSSEPEHATRPCPQHDVPAGEVTCPLTLQVAPQPRLVSVVIPVYDEEANVLPLVQEVRQVLDGSEWPWELVLVDDGSRDGTAAACAAAAGQEGAVKWLSLSRNMGQSAALQAGIDHAAGDVICTMDGDLQNDATDIPMLVRRLWQEDLDVVVGWRCNRQDTWWRRLPSTLANGLLRVLTGVQLHDVGSGLKAMRACILRAAPLHGDMHRMLPLWLATATDPRRIAEQPVHHRARRFGHSKYGFSRLLPTCVDMLLLAFLLRFGRIPVQTLGGCGLVFAAASLPALALGHGLAFWMLLVLAWQSWGAALVLQQQGRGMMPGYVVRRQQGLGISGKQQEEIRREREP